MDGKAPEDKIDALANIAVIGPSINIRISAKDPMSYITKYKISAEKLEQQYIASDITAVSTEEFPGWVDARAARLASAANDLLDGLREGI